MFNLSGDVQCSEVSGFGCQETEVRCNEAGKLGSSEAGRLGGSEAGRLGGWEAGRLGGREAGKPVSGSCASSTRRILPFS